MQAEERWPFSLRDYSGVQRNAVHLSVVSSSREMETSPEQDETIPRCLALSTNVRDITRYVPLTILGEPSECE